jgi:hypothetical protein
MHLGRSSDTGMPVSGYVKPGSPATVARCPADTGMDGWSQSVMALPIPDAGSPPGTQHAALAGRSRRALAMPTPNQACKRWLR